MSKNQALKIFLFVAFAIGLAAGVTACSSSNSNNDPVVTLKGAST